MKFQHNLQRIIYYIHLFKQRESYTNKVISSRAQLTTHHKAQKHTHIRVVWVQEILPKLISGNHNCYSNLESGTLGLGNSGTGNGYWVFCPDLATEIKKKSTATSQVTSLCPPRPWI
jgi:hypothetical protein